MVDDVWGLGGQVMMMPLTEIYPPRLAWHNPQCIRMAMVAYGQSVDQDLRLRQYKTRDWCNTNSTPPGNFHLQG